MDDNFENLLDDYTIPPVAVPLSGWATEDLVQLEQLVNAELQSRAHEAYRKEVDDAYREHQS